MDVLKLAFETVIIGLFALPWLWVMIDLVNPGRLSFSNIKCVVTRIPTELRAPAISLTLFSMVYLLGSMIIPVSHEFLNDGDLLPGGLPPEQTIQIATFKQMMHRAPDRDQPAQVEQVSRRGSQTASDQDPVYADFLLAENTLLLHANDISARLDRLHEQRAVLQGATFSAFALTVLCGFAWCGRSSNKRIVIGGKPFLRQQLRCSIGLVLSSAIIVWYGKAFLADVQNHNIKAGDMPIAELVLLILGCVGLYVAMYGTRSRLKFHGMAFVFALCFTLLCYTGYGCTERSYDQEVFKSFHALSSPKGGDGTPAATHATLAASSE